MAALFAVLQGLPALIQSLPEFFRLLLKCMQLFESFMGWAKQVKLEGWVDDVEKVFDELNKADTPEKKRGAARGLIGVIRRLS